MSKNDILQNKIHNPEIQSKTYAVIPDITISKLWYKKGGRKCILQKSESEDITHLCRT